MDVVRGRSRGDRALRRGILRRVASVAGVSLLALTTASCGEERSAQDRVAATPTADPPTSSSRPLAGDRASGEPFVDAEGVATLRRWTESMLASYSKIYRSVPAMVRESSIALTGTVDAVVEGRSTVVTAADGRSGTRDSRVVVRVKVADQVKVEAPGVVADGYAYVVMLRAVNDVDRRGEVVGLDTYPTLAELQQALPVGTRVAILAEPDLRGLEGPERIEADPNPLPPGAVPVSGGGQAVVFDQGSGVALDPSVTLWNDLSFDELVAQMR